MLCWKLVAIKNTIVCMLQLGLFAMHVLEVLFFVGMAGSVIVLITIAVRMVFHSLTGTSELVQASDSGAKSH